MLSILLLAHGIESNPGPTNNNLRFCHFNARSLLSGVDKTQLLKFQVSKFDEIDFTLSQTEDFDLIGISETWLDKEVLSSYISLEGYQLPFRRDRESVLNINTNNGGGVCLFVKCNLAAKRREDLEPPTSEVVWTEITLPGKEKLLFGVAYRPPNQTALQRDTFLDDISLSLNQALNDSADCIICVGDFNDRCLNWHDDHQTSEVGRRLVNIVHDLNLFQLVDSPTRITENYAYLLDLIITDSPAYIQNCSQLMPMSNMDHNVIYGDLVFTKAPKVTLQRDVWHYNNADIVGLNAALANAPWDTGLILFDDIDDTVQYFQNLLVSVAKEFIPFRKITIRSKDKPWFTGYLRHLIRIRNRWNGIFSHTKRLEHREIRNYYRQLVHCEIKIAKENYTIRQKERLNDPNINIKVYYSITKSLYGGKVISGIPTLIEGDNALTSDTDKANAFCQLFADQCTLAPIPQGFSLPQFTFLTEKRINSADVSPDKVEKVLKSLKTNKSCGTDGISNRLLKICSDSIAKPLSDIFQKSLDQEIFPSHWKMGNWSPVYKKNEKFLKENYRPISLLPCPSKVMERLVFLDLYKYFDSNMLLTERNSGFKQLDSTVNQLVHITNSIYKSLNDGKDVCMVFLDISKAFDRVYHDGLIFKLKQLGVTGKLLGWLRSYLSGRQQRVVLNGKSSDWRNINSGVPQGSVLGPLLFLVYINDILDDLQSLCYIFADDTSFLNEISKANPDITAVHINNELVTLNAWSRQWLLPFNALKTKYMIFSKRKNRPKLRLLFDGVELEEVQSHTHLGLTFDNSMTWQFHIDFICDKVSKRVSGLRLIRKLVPRKTLEHLYTVMIRPVIEYACTVFDNITITNSIRLERLQRSAAIICTGAFSITPTDNLLKELGWDTLASRRKYHRMVLMYKMTKDMVPDYLKRLLPPYNHNRTMYNLRNRENITLVQTKKMFYGNSFLPASVNDWNKLPIDLRNSVSLDIFKERYKSLFLSKSIPFYKTGLGIGALNHTRLRLGVSGLRSHLFKYNIIESPVCNFCNIAIENEVHYVLHCPTFAAQRNILLSNLINIIPFNVLSSLSEKDLVNLLINGSVDLEPNVIKNVFDHFQNFIVNTKRFEFNAS